jgi:hypothetical protein
MRGRPFANQSLGGSRRNAAGEEISAEIEGRSLSAMFRVKVRGGWSPKYIRIMIPKKAEMIGMRLINYFDASVL